MFLRSRVLKLVSYYIIYFFSNRDFLIRMSPSNPLGDAPKYIERLQKN